MLAGAAIAAIGGCSDEPPPAPPQPLAYSHKAHIDAGLECSRCHRGAERAKEAGLPEMRACVTCHRRRIPDHPEIIKLKELFEIGEPLLGRGEFLDNMIVPPTAASLGEADDEKSVAMTDLIPDEGKA